MLPYQAVAMDYAAGFQRHPGVPPGGGPPFTHTWFVPADLCFKQNPTQMSLMEPGILELRKEKSRDAARSRRGKENFEFYELAKMLPLPAAITSQLDKASIIRLTISYLKLRDFSGHGDPPWSRDLPIHKSVKNNPGRSRSTAGLAMDLFEQHQGTHILQSLDGFAFALAADGRFLYISETVSIYLGLSQVEMTGSSVFDYVHHGDHSEMAEHLGLGLSQGQSPGSAHSEDNSGTSTTGTANPDVSSQMSLNTSSIYKGLERSFCVRMKSTLTKRGCHFKSSGYRVVLMLCRLRPQYTFSHSRKTSPPLLGMVSLAIALPPPSVHEIRLESDMFVTRVNFDFRIAHCEPRYSDRVSELLDYTAEELTGMNLYTLCHGEDVSRLRKSHLDLIHKGQVLTHYYRLMNKCGGFTWLQTCATVVCSAKNAEEQNIICVNYVLSGKEYENLVMDCCQLEDHIAQRVKREETSGNNPENGSPDADGGDGRSSGPPHNREHHLTPPEMEDGASSTPGEQRGRQQIDHSSQLRQQADQQMSSTLASQSPKKPSLIEKPLQVPAQAQAQAQTQAQVQGRRVQKRKLLLPTQHREGDNSSSEEDIPAARRCLVLSPASSCHSSVAQPSPRQHPPEENDPPGPTTAATSVKDLEQAMSKHLPSSPPSLSQPTDFSTDSLLKQQQRSTIQWIGTHHLQNGAPLPASSLLRQLYANRESVIRATVTSGRSGSSPSGGYYPGSEINHVGPLPTPPGSESSYCDQFLKSSTEPFSMYSHSGTNGYDYHSAMTPPSSVSPRDKHQQQLHSNGAFDNSVYTDVLRHQYLSSGNGGDIPAQPFPLKPQPYAAVHPSALDAAYATGSLEQSQFYHHSAGFHLYHPTASKAFSAASDPLKNSTSWYSAPS
nr:PREDICTED: protein trachealess isoform X3 [Bemisia tabaci]